LRRSLSIMGQHQGGAPPAPVCLRVGERTVAVSDTHDGSSAARFAGLLVAEGAAIVATSLSGEADFRIVVRATARARSARGYRASFDETADIVLEAPRAGFARCFVANLTTSSPK
jgi:hypothetical protein